MASWSLSTKALKWPAISPISSVESTCYPLREVTYGHCLDDLDGPRHRAEDDAFMRRATPRGRMMAARKTMAEMTSTAENVFSAEVYSPALSFSSYATNSSRFLLKS